MQNVNKMYIWWKTRGYFTNIHSSLSIVTIRFYNISLVILGIDQANAQILVLQGEHKVFPWLQTFITRKLLYMEYKYIFF
jgi:hypothetical protein